MKRGRSPGAGSRPASPGADHVRTSTGSADDTALRYVWLVLLAVPVWLFGYWDASQSPASLRSLFLLYGIVLLVEGFRTAWVRHRPSHPLNILFPIFDAIALYWAIRLTNGTESEFWLLYLFQLVVGALDPDPRALRVLGILSVVSYAMAVLPTVRRDDWIYFLGHLHFIPRIYPHPMPAPLSAGPHSDAVPRLITRIFFLFVIGRMAQAIARSRSRQENEIALLREQIGLAEDRGRIARDLHDSLNHTLIGSVLRLELCGRLLKRDPAEAARLLDEEKAALRGAIESVRDYVFHLRPAELEAETLAALLQGYVRRFEERTGIEVELDAKDAAEPDPAVRIAVARIVQEAMTNAAKHAGARHITVAVKRDGERSMRVKIEDDGRGFDLEAVKGGGIGMAGMRERAEAVHGRLEVRSAPERGTTITALFPLR